MQKETPPAVDFSQHEAHPFQPSPSAAPGEHCALCGERREQIRHHPTRIAAACLLRGIDPASVLPE